MSKGTVAARSLMKISSPVIVATGEMPSTSNRGEARDGETSMPPAAEGKT